METKNLRELTGNRDRQDPEHVQHHRDCGGADTQATHLLRRDGTQQAPNPRRNVSEDGVPGVLPRPDQPGGTSSSLLTIHPERKTDEKRHPKPDSRRITTTHCSGSYLSTVQENMFQSNSSKDAWTTRLTCSMGQPANRAWGWWKPL